MRPLNRMLILVGVALCALNAIVAVAHHHSPLGWLAAIVYAVGFYGSLR